MRHRWNVKPKKAVDIQNRLKESLILKKGFKEVKRIAGVDVSFSKDEKKGRCAIIVYSYPHLKIIEQKFATKSVRFPYIPGLLSFREGPVILSAYKKIKDKPDIIIFDGQGIAHPRRMGIASHIGIILNKPTIGCAKNLLYGNYKEPSKKRGSFNYIKKDSEIIGAAVRTRDYTRCVYVSVGYKIDIKGAIDIVLRLSPKYRIPEPLRAAHTASKIQNNVFSD